MSRTSSLYRLAAAMLLALLLAVRLLSPAGFMPAFDRGAVTIVGCPDFDPPPAPMTMPGHHHHDPGKHHQTCPYGAGSFAATVATALLLGAVLLLLPIAIRLGGPSLFFKRRAHDRPPSRGPPVTA